MASRSFLRIEFGVCCTWLCASWLLLHGCSAHDAAPDAAETEAFEDAAAEDAAAEEQVDPHDAADAAPGAKEAGASEPDARAGSTDGAVTLADGGAAPSACKRGVAYNNEQAIDADAFGQAIGWWYDWAAAPSGAALNALESHGVEFAPMVWSGPPRRDIDVQGLIRTIPKSAKYLLGFNEPNFGAQANLTAEEAAAAWPKLEEIARARNLKLVSPAVNYCGGSCNQTDPFKWLDAFFAACKDCQVDYVAFHWYACSIEALKSTVEKYKKYKKPLWLTEFACLDDPGDHSAAGQLAYMDKAVPFLESEPQVFRYAWFIGRSSKPAAIDLFSDKGLTPLGNAYVGYGDACP